MSEAIVIVSAGMVTPVGLSLAETAASARSRVARLQEIPWRDRRYENFVAGVVPDEGLPPLAAGLLAEPLQCREGRMLRLAHVALDEALANISPVGPLQILLALPEQHSRLPVVPVQFLMRLQTQAGVSIDQARSVAVPRGRAAAIMALLEAANRLRQGQTEFVLVGGVDSLVDLYVLGTLDLQGRIRNAVNSDGFAPGEGAAFLSLCTARTAEQRGLPVLAELLGASLGQESGHLYAEEPYLGEGLAAAFANLLAESPPPAPIGCVYSSFNGERYWAREYGVARLRSAQAFAEDHQMEHPAEVFGDLGAAHGATLLALAAHGVRHGYRRAPCLVYASSDHADRAASLLVRAV
ncbi:MAG: hypothetical protein HGA75_09465 [Thiobacillus sp.]|nr:hypothetical protein [Thiobacillus sp.]